MFKSTGIIKTSCVDNIYKLIVEVDQGISDFYLSLIPKYFNIRKQRYPAHISVIREASKVDFDNYNNLKVDFTYSNQIYIESYYAWLNVECDYLKQIRHELNLGDLSWYTRPPDGNDSFHITIGNFKHLK